MQTWLEFLDEILGLDEDDLIRYVLSFVSVSVYKLRYEREEVTGRGCMVMKVDLDERPLRSWEPLSKLDWPSYQIYRGVHSMLAPTTRAPTMFEMNEHATSIYVCLLALMMGTCDRLYHPRELDGKSRFCDDFVETVIPIARLTKRNISYLRALTAREIVPRPWVPFHKFALKRTVRSVDVITFTCLREDGALLWLQRVPDRPHVRTLQVYGFGIYSAIDHAHCGDAFSYGYMLSYSGEEHEEIL